LFWTISPGGKMRVLYGRLLTSDDNLTKQAMKNLNAKYTFFGPDGLFIPYWGDYQKICRLLCVYWRNIKVVKKNWSEEETKVLWKTHPEIWVRRPDLLPNLSVV